MRESERNLCVCDREREQKNWTDICVCVKECERSWERNMFVQEREREREGEHQTEMCVCL